MKKIKLISILGVKVYLHWSFLLLITWILIMQVAERADMRQMVWAVAAVLSIFACVVLHELGHALVAARFKIRTSYILLWPLGGMTIMERRPASPAEDISIGLAGPVVNILIALLTLPFIKIYVPFWQAAAVINSVGPFNFFLYLHTINMILAVFNLLPAFPMDGGRVLKGLLGLFLPAPRATRIALVTGQVLAVVFIIAGILSFNLSLPLIGIFILLGGIAESRLLYLQAGVKGLRIKDLMMKDYTTLQANFAIWEAAQALLPTHFQYVVVYDKNSIVTVLDRGKIIKALGRSAAQQTLHSLVRYAPYIPDEQEPADGIIEKLLYHEHVAFAVTSCGELAGIISLENIVEYMMIRDAKKAGHSPGTLLAKLIYQG